MVAVCWSKVNQDPGALWKADTTWKFVDTMICLPRSGKGKEWHSGYSHFYGLVVICVFLFAKPILEDEIGREYMNGMKVYKNNQ